ncbi:hypothetical protein [Devosia sp. 2618]|uniref:hypothetical protein n=1 Tax=Devosia sp. 2618 TaxID=3156454 RepID=UPI00339B7844
MKLYVIDQVSISAVQSDTLKPGDAFAVSDAYGDELLIKLPHAVSKTPPKGHADADAKAKADADAKAKADADAKTKADADAKTKADQLPSNKAEQPPANKAS